MPDRKELIHQLVAHRHDSDDALTVLQMYIEDTDGDAVQTIHDLCYATLQLTQLVHRLGHIHPKIDRMLEAMLMHGPDALDADITQSVPLAKLMTDEYTRKVFDALTEGTNPQDRVWDVIDIQGDHRAITLEGSGFPKKVFGLVGATPEMVEAFKARMVQYEADLK